MPMGLGALIRVRSKDPRANRALRIRALGAVLATLVVLAALLRPRVEDREREIATRPAAAQAPDIESSEMLSPPPEGDHRELPPITRSARSTEERTTAAAAEPEPSFTLELTIEAPGAHADALERASIEVVPHKPAANSKDKGEAWRKGRCLGRSLQYGGKPMLEIEHLCLGKWTASIEAKGFVTDREVITCNENGARVRAKLRLLPERTFVVAIHDLAGAPLDRSTLLSPDVRTQLADRIVPHVCEDAPRGALDSRSSCTATTYRCTHVGKDRDLEFKVETGGSGTLWVGASFGDAILAWIGVPEGAERIVLEVPTDAVLAAFRTVEVRVRDGDHHGAIDGARVRIQTVNGQELQLVTDRDGRARAASVAQGAGTIRVRKEGYGSERARFDTRSAVATLLEVELAPEITLRGTLVGKDGLPMAGTLAAISEAMDPLPQDGIIDDHALAGDDGAFEFRGLSRGTYLIVDARWSSAAIAHLASKASDGALALPNHITRVDARHGSVSGLVVRSLLARR